jgi:hypothetical protein
MKTSIQIDLSGNASAEEIEDLTQRFRGLAGAVFPEFTFWTTTINPGDSPKFTLGMTPKYNWKPASPVPVEARQIGIAEAVRRWNAGEIGSSVTIRPKNEDPRSLCQGVMDAGYFFEGRPFRPTPEAAIREQLAAGVKVFSGDAEIVEPAALVPLGANRTRDGREARVIANDLSGEQFQVCYVQVNEAGTEHSPVLVSSTGSYLNMSSNHPFDLVGHIQPPEPPKPREIWVATKKGADGHGVIWSSEKNFSLMPEEREYVKFREVLPTEGGAE